LLAKEITNKQFEDPAAREHQRQKSIEQKKSSSYIEKHQKSMETRTARWKEAGHPRTGKLHTEDAKFAIGKSNTGRFKGKTWEEIFGPEVAEKRRKQNSNSMSKKNEVLLKDKRSNLETKLIPYLTDYENNIQIGYYNVDFINRKTNHIIEVYGDYWHCNPKIYNEDFMHPHLKMTASMKHSIDKDRVSYLEEKGYSVTVIWESDLDNFISNSTP